MLGVGKPGRALQILLDPFLSLASAREPRRTPEVGPRKVQGELEVGVRLVLKARHMANELPNVALLLRVQFAPM